MPLTNAERQRRWRERHCRRKVSDAWVRQVVRRFENAVANYQFLGTIPYGESEAAAEAYDAIVLEYERAKGAMFRLLDRLNA